MAERRLEISTNAVVTGGAYYDTLDEEQLLREYASMAVAQTAFKGVCAGGLNELTEEVPDDLAVEICDAYIDNLDDRINDIGTHTSTGASYEEQYTDTLNNVFAPNMHEQDGMSNGMYE